MKRLDDVGSLPVWSIDGSHLPDDMLALLDHRLPDLAGTYGDPEAGEPIQHDELRIEHDRGAVEIVIYNRATCCSRPAPRR